MEHRVWPINSGSLSGGLFTFGQDQGCLEGPVGNDHLNQQLVSSLLVYLFSNL
jgi:hypothetical protein